MRYIVYTYDCVYRFLSAFAHFIKGLEYQSAAFRVIMINDRVSGEGETDVGANAVNNSRARKLLITRNSRRSFPFDSLDRPKFCLLCQDEKVTL